MEAERREWLERLRETCAKITARLQADMNSTYESGTGMLFEDVTALHARLTRELREEARRSGAVRHARRR